MDKWEALWQWLDVEYQEARFKHTDAVLNRDVLWYRGILDGLAKVRQRMAILEAIQIRRSSNQLNGTRRTGWPETVENGN